MTTTKPIINYGNYQQFIKDNQIIFFNDGGHGWLQVPKKFLRELEIHDQISGYSYEKSGYVYLEEDCDLAKFLFAATGNDKDLAKTFFHSCPEKYEDESRVRNYNRYSK